MDLICETQQTFTELLFSNLVGPFGSVRDERINSLRACDFCFLAIIP